MNEHKTPCNNASIDIDNTFSGDYGSLLTAFNAMQKSRDHYAALYNHAPVGLVVLTPQGCIRDINPAGARLLGARKSSVLSMPLSAYIAKDDMQVFLNHIHTCNNTTKNVQSELTLDNKQREVQLLSTNIHASDSNLISTMIIDVTERNFFEHNVARLDRLQLIGEMAAGIAHEIRNPLTTVLGYLQLFQNKKQLSDYHEAFLLMSEEVLRANAIITEFLSLAKNKHFSPIYLNLNQIITALHPLINADALLQGKSLSLELADALPLVLIDADEFRQVILNLTRNGLQAMNTGTLTLQTYLEHGKLVFAVRDHGLGMTKEVQTKIGTPFFTTKPDGTGLGLAICYNIAARHHAELKFDTSDEGTTFYLRFGANVLREKD